MSFWQYFGVDWVAMILTFMAIWQIGNQNRIGLALMMCGNTSWMIVGYFSESMAMIIANVLFFVMNVRAILKWSASSKNKSISA